MAPEMMIVKNNSNVTHWSLSNGYQDNLSKDEYPISVEYSGKGSALDLVLQLHERDLEHNCFGSNGFAVTLRTPGEARSMLKNIIEMQTSEEIHIVIRPKIITTSDGLHNYGVDQRQCFHQYERQLRFYKMYTHGNCEEECIANYTKQLCGCVKFSMPSNEF